MNQDLTVTCLKVKPAYTSEYVNRLYRAVERNLTVPHRFVCLTDDPVGISRGVEIVRVDDTRFSGWWHKLILFKPPSSIAGRILYFDLDTLITGCIDDFANYGGDFAVIRPFVRKSGYASGVMSIAPGFGSQVWSLFAANPARAIRSCTPPAGTELQFYCGFDSSINVFSLGDQRWIETNIPRADYWQDLCPGQLVSFRLHCLSAGTIPPAARIVAFHGNPKPHDVENLIGGFWF